MEADPCIYIREVQITEKGEPQIRHQLVALYVGDDLIIAASTKNLITDLEI